MGSDVTGLGGLETFNVGRCFLLLAAWQAASTKLWAGVAHVRLLDPPQQHNLVNVGSSQPCCTEPRVLRPWTGSLSSGSEQPVPAAPPARAPPWWLESLGAFRILTPRGWEWVRGEPGTRILKLPAGFTLQPRLRATAREFMESLLCVLSTLEK